MRPLPASRPSPGEPAPEAQASPEHPPVLVLLRDLGQAFRQDRLIHAAIALYAAFATLLGWALPGHQPLVFLSYLPAWIATSSVMLAVGLMVTGRRRRLKRQAEAAAATPAEARRSRIAARLIANVFLVLAIAVFMGVFTSVKNMLPQIAGGYAWDLRLADLDRALHGGIDPWRLLQPLMGRPFMHGALSVIYGVVWFSLLCGVPLLVAFSERAQAMRRQYFLTFLLTWIVLGNLIAGLFLSGGPAYFAEMTGGLTRFQPLLDYQRRGSGAFWSSYDAQVMLWYLYDSGRVQLGSGISAFPSLHVAMATLTTLTAWRLGRRWGAAAILLLIAVMAGSVHLGWHYAIDGYASVILTSLLWIMVGRFAIRPVTPPAANR